MNTEILGVEFGDSMHNPTLGRESEMFGQGGLIEHLRNLPVTDAAVGILAFEGLRKSVASLSEKGK